MTISSTAFAGPRPAIAVMTVHVINAPMTPPSSMYLWSTCASDKIPACFRSNIAHRNIAVKKPENATHAEASHVDVCFVTPVLNTPWTLIRAPDINATIIPHIKNYLHKSVIYRGSLYHFHEIHTFFRIRSFAYRD